MYIKYDNIHNYSKTNYHNFFQSLTPNDQKKVKKLQKENDKKLTILGKILLKNLLKEKYNLDYSQTHFYYNDNQKPLMNNLYFNISHSNDYTIVATSYQPIGIDIEKIREVNLNIINSFCTKKETEYIQKGENKMFRLFQIFCLKEAYFKMLGTNLFSIKQIEFTIDDHQITCSLRDDLNIILNYEIPNYIIAIIEEKPSKIMKQ